MNYIEFLVVLIPIAIGCMFAKRYNFIMGVVATVFVGYLIPFFLIKMNSSILESIDGFEKGVVYLYTSYGLFIDTEIGKIINNIGINFKFLVDYSGVILLTLVFLIVLVPSSKLRALRRRSRS